MFEDLLLHPRTRTQLEQFAANPSHGLILIGPEGSGKKTLAHAVSAVLLSVENDKLANHPYYSLTNPDDPSITIDEIRALQRLLTLKTPKTNDNIRRVLTTIDAGRMRFEAQNAFLKSLEEPPTDTCIILTVDATGDLLETMYSRAQKIDILPVSEAMAKEYYSKKGITSVELAKNYALSQGQVGLLSSLLSVDTNHPLKEWVETAKGLLAQPAGERIMQTDVLSKDKLGVLLLLNAFGRIAHAALTSAAKTSNAKAIERWKDSLEAVQNAHEAMTHNANTKLMLDHLLLSI
ncbi:MAG: polymerase delta prime subunit [Candidatus Saccharibacteria bacterium]|nr:polymerase delta prime subunit [Candidatus Saccharibacteria bacterium]